MSDGLWGSEFITSPTKQLNKKLLQKAMHPLGVEKKVKTSKSLTIEENILLVEKEVNRILGRFKENIVVIRDYDGFVSYIDKAIQNGDIAIDTETNNSLDPISCKLMGACIYTPGEKWAYISVNHIDIYTKEKLPRQITEEQIKEQFDRLTKTNIIMHNGKFDYEVIHCTCNCDLDIYWDTIIGAKLLNENEEAGLKYQYISKIDSSIEKYDIEHLFKSIPYEYFSPELFALYAATDSYMTYELYKYQVKEFKREENKKLFNLFRTIEMPIVRVCADMELTGVCIDEERSKRLSNKWNKKLIPINEAIRQELDKYKKQIDEWRKTDDAKSVTNGSKTKNEQLSDPPEVTSNLQLSILLYDILKVPVVDKETPRGTGVDILKQIDLPICKLILKKREVEKLLSTYIDKLPKCVNKKTGRIHANFNQLGAKTGRFSSNNPNLQNIPSHVKEIRTMFVPGYTEKDVQVVNNEIILNYDEEILLSNGIWKGVAEISVGDIIHDEEENKNVMVERVYDHNGLKKIFIGREVM